jgi:acyl-CoA synthetase (AMP-forming)/AMP-acid ligase II
MADCSSIEEALAAVQSFGVGSELTAQARRGDPSGNPHRDEHAHRPRAALTTVRLLPSNRRLAACLLALALAGAVTAPAAGRLVNTKRWWTPHSQLWVAWNDGSGAHRLLSSLTHPSATDWAATITIPATRLRQIGQPSRANGPLGVAGDAISRDGRAVLATKRTSQDLGGIDVVTLPFLGGRPHVLARHAMDPSWSR